MKITRRNLPAKWLFCGGLLIVSLVPLLNRYVPMPDFWHGLLMGAGIGLEIIGAIKLIQLKQRKVC